MVLKSPQKKGKRAELEVVSMFRDAGYSRAARAPGSGAMRPYGPGDLSPWPGDLCFVRPWLVEVKHDQKVGVRGRGWQGSSFVKRVLRDNAKLATRHSGAGQRRPIPVLFARADRMPWRVFVPVGVFHEAINGRWVTVSQPIMFTSAYVEVDPFFFFSQIEPFVEAGDRDEPAAI